MSVNFNQSACNPPNQTVVYQLKISQRTQSEMSFISTQFFDLLVLKKIKTTRIEQNNPIAIEITQVFTTAVRVCKNCGCMVVFMKPNEISVKMRLNVDFIINDILLSMMRQAQDPRTKRT